MLSKVIVLSGLLAVVLSARLQEPVPILSEHNVVNPDGSYQWDYQSGDGSAQQQSGQLKQIGDEAGQAVQGYAFWLDPEGGQHSISYVADENGYQPTSEDLPVGPEIPAAIVRALEWIKSHPQPQNQQ